MLADEMGLGKTVQSVATLNYIWKAGGTAPKSGTARLERARLERAPPRALRMREHRQAHAETPSPCCDARELRSRLCVLELS
eukprot:515619-Pleurochrysis_carterae.AAC.2